MLLKIEITLNFSKYLSFFLDLGAHEIFDDFFQELMASVKSEEGCEVMSAPGQKSFFLESVVNKDPK